MFRDTEVYHEHPTYEKTISSHGYVRVSCPSHPYADVTGRVYEHRLVMERKIGRYLLPYEKVHHVNGDKQDNSPSNLELCESIADHRLKHRKSDSKRRKPGEDNPLVVCMCGCKEELLRYDAAGRPRSYIARHGVIGSGRKRVNPLPLDIDDIVVCACGCGTLFPKYDGECRIRKFVSGHNRRKGTENAI